MEVGSKMMSRGGITSNMLEAAEDWTLGDVLDDLSKKARREIVGLMKEAFEAYAREFSWNFGVDHTGYAPELHYVGPGEGDDFWKGEPPVVIEASLLGLADAIDDYVSDHVDLDGNNCLTEHDRDKLVDMLSTWRTGIDALIDGAKSLPVVPDEEDA